MASTPYLSALIETAKKWNLKFSVEHVHKVEFSRKSENIYVEAATDSEILDVPWLEKKFIEHPEGVMVKEYHHQSDRTWYLYKANGKSPSELGQCIFDKYVLN